MKKLILIQMIIAACTFAQSRQLTLEESLRIGLANSKEIKISQSKVIGANAKITEATSYMLPTISVGASYFKLSDIPAFEVSIPGAPALVRIQDPILNSYALKLSLQQPLFTGFRLSSLRSAAKMNYKAVEAEHSNEINTEAFKIQEAFWNYTKAKQVSELIDQNTAVLIKHVEDTKLFLENGLVTKNDMLKLEVELSNVKLKQIDAHNMVNISRAAFNKTIGLPLNSPTDIITKDISVKILEDDFNSLLPEAFANRDELKSLSYRVNAGNDGVRAANAGWFPSVYLTGNFYYSRPNQRIMPAEDKFNDTWDVGVSLQWNICNWGKTSSQVEQAEQLVIQSETMLDKIKEAVQLEVYKNYLQLSSEIQKVELNKLTVEQARENYRITKDKYNAQLATSTDLIDAETSLLNAETNLTNALIDYKIAVVKLDKSIGRKIY